MSVMNYIYHDNISILRYIAMQRSGVKRTEYTEEMYYIPANMIVLLDETGSDWRNERRTQRYHLRGMILPDFRFTVWKTPIFYWHHF